jgi:DNA-directed RNA polymerase I subunit RPA1
MFQLLRAKCAYCHRLRLSRLQVQLILCKLRLLELGDVTAADALDHLSSSHAATVLEDVVAKQDLAINIESKIREVETRYFAHLKKTGVRPAGLEMKSKQRTATDAFLKGCVAAKKCESCGGYSPAYRKDGYSKIFQKPLAKKTQKAMQALKMKLKTALESTQGDTGKSGNGNDSDDDEIPMEESDDEDDNGKAAAGADKYMVQSEVEAQIKVRALSLRESV